MKLNVTPSFAANSLTSSSMSAGRLIHFAFLILISSIVNHIFLSDVAFSVVIDVNIIKKVFLPVVAVVVGS